MYIRKSNEYTDQRAAMFIIDALATFLGHSDLSRSTRCRINLFQLSERLTDGIEAGLRQLATDCVRAFRYSFDTLNLAENVSLSILFFCD